MRWKNWWVGVGVALLVVLVACAKEAPTGYEYLGSPSSKAMIQPAEFMAAVGCGVGTGRPDTGWVIISLAGRRPMKFNCRGIPRDSVRAAQLRFQSAVAEALGGAATLMGYWTHEWISSREWCYSYGHWEDDGLFHNTEAGGVWDCYWVDTYSNIFHVWDDGQGEHPEGTDTPTGDPEPTLPQVDSLRISPASATMDVGGTKYFQVKGFFQNGDSTDVTGLASFTIGGSGALVPDGDIGAFTAVGRGSATLTASAGGKTATALVTVVDTACIAVSDPTPILPGLTTDSWNGPSYGPLASLSLQSTLEGLTNAPNQPEKGGRVWYRVSTKTYGFTPVSNDSNSACDYYPVGGYYGQAGLQENGDLVILGYAHGHPDEGVTLSSAMCHRQPGTAVFGVSPQDRVAADSLSYLTNRNYVVQKDSSGQLRMLTYGSIWDIFPPHAIVPDSNHVYTKAVGACAARQS